MQFSETIFITGFPGFIAGQMIERLAGASTQFLLLVQPQFFEKAKSQIEEIAAKTVTPLENFVIVRGDITLPNIGMSADDAEFAARETTDVFHLAAIYDLGVARELAERVNLEGTRNVNKFLRTIGNLRRYNYVSTCYVAGKREGVIREDELEHDAGFRNFYEETKYLAELEVKKLKAEMPVTIFRPSVVCGDSRSGETAKYDGVYYLIRYLKRSPALLSKINIGNDHVKLNLVPVDFVADAIVALSRDERAVGKTFQLADPVPLTTGDMFTVIAKELDGGNPVATLPDSVSHWLLETPLTPSLTGLPHFAVPYFFIKQVYDTTETERLLERYGISCPSFASYAGKLCEFENAHPELWPTNK